MRPRPSLASHAAVLVFGLVVGSFLNRPSVGQPQPVQAGPVGRYQMVVARELGPVIFAVDTTTGQVWSKAAQNVNWQDAGTPLAPGK
jgi:hypothetical protein